MGSVKQQSSLAGLFQVIQLSSVFADLPTTVALCQCSKHMKALCLDKTDLQLQDMLAQAVRQLSTSNSQASQLQPSQGRATLPTTSVTYSMAWMLQRCCKDWGIITLATRLNLSQLLLEAQGNEQLSFLLISAGARITEGLIDHSLQLMYPGPSQWLNVYSRLGLAADLPPVLYQVCTGACPSIPQLQSHQQHSAQPLQLAKVSLLNPRGAVPFYLLHRLLYQQALQWSPEELHSLLQIALAVPSSAGPQMEPYIALARHPAAANIAPEQLLKLLELGAASPYHVGLTALKQALMPDTALSPAQAMELCWASLSLPTAQSFMAHVKLQAICKLVQAHAYWPKEELVELIKKGLQTNHDIGSFLPHISAGGLPLQAAAELAQLAACSSTLDSSTFGNLLGAVNLPPKVAAAQLSSLPQTLPGRLQQDHSSGPSHSKCSSCSLISYILQHSNLQELKLEDALLIFKAARKHSYGSAQLLRLLKMAIMRDDGWGLACLLEHLPPAQAQVSDKEAEAALLAALELVTLCIPASNPELLQMLLGSLSAVQMLPQWAFLQLLHKAISASDSWSLSCLLIQLPGAAAGVTPAEVVELARAALLSSDPELLQMLLGSLSAVQMLPQWAFLQLLHKAISASDSWSLSCLLIQLPGAAAGVTPAEVVELARAALLSSDPELLQVLLGSLPAVQRLPQWAFLQLLHKAISASDSWSLSCLLIQLPGAAAGVTAAEAVELAKAGLLSSDPELLQVLFLHLPAAQSVPVQPL